MSCKTSFLSLLSVVFLLGCAGTAVQSPSDDVSSISSTDGGGLGSSSGGGTSTPQTLNIVIKNLNTKYNDSNVFFTFRSAPVTGTIGGEPLNLNQSYSIIDPNTGTPFRNEASNLWWASPQAFGFLQPNNAYYDPYASYLKTVSDAYGSPFSDRWESVQAPLDSSITTLEIDVLPD